jgi:hypothetical protein
MYPGYVAESTLIFYVPWVARKLAAYNYYPSGVGVDELWDWDRGLGQAGSQITFRYYYIAHAHSTTLDQMKSVPSCSSSVDHEGSIIIL